MNKAELVDAVADAADLSKADAGRAVDAVFERHHQGPEEGRHRHAGGLRHLRGPQARAPVPGRNPRTGETIKIAASKNPAFKAGKALKDAVN